MKIQTLLYVILFPMALGAQSGKEELALKTATNHPMQYYVSLPQGWNQSRTWPVVIILEAADKEFKKNAERFIKARGNYPFILVAPINTDNGNQGRRDPNVFPYTIETWDYIDKVGDCQFNNAGIKQIIKDITELYRGEGQVYITGFEAGAHGVWALVFNDPEYVKAAAPVAGNFRNRCVDESTLVKHKGVSDLPIQSFVGKEDSDFGPQGQIYNQWQAAKQLAVKQGFQNIKEVLIPGKQHEPMPAEVLDYFYSLFQK